MPWLSRIRRAERETQLVTADPAARLAVLAEQQADVARKLREIVEELRKERENA